MKTKLQLQQELDRIHRKSYPAYKDLRGQYDFGEYVLSIDHVQGDPFAAPSNVSVIVPMQKAGFPQKIRSEESTRVALEDALLRRFSKHLAEFSFRAKGSGKSGLLATSRPGPEILRRSAMRISDQAVTARFEVGFPANGRTINSDQLEKILFEFLPIVVRKSIYYKSWNPRDLQKVYELACDQQFLREQLPERNLIAFLAQGAILPRASGISSSPLPHAIPLTVPETLAVEFELPFRGRVRGMGIPEGVTLIIGGGYHGKSTLLQALEQGVYNHVAGDGREYVITDATALKLRAEDGRSIRNLDLSLFIHNLPNGKDTKCFSTADASGSTSQAAAVIEGVEAGSRVFLIDEDTSATNFLVRDEFMQKVVHGDKEPITPFCACIRDLYVKAGISTVLVAGSSGAFFHLADTVIQMDAYCPKDVKEKVDRLLADYPLPVFEAEPFALPTENRMFWGLSSGGAGQRKGDRMKTKVQSTDGFTLNHEKIDLRYVEQLADSEQTAALAAMMQYVIGAVRGSVSVKQLADLLETKLKKEGLETFLGGNVRCGCAEPRRQEIFAMLNRYRG